MKNIILNSLFIFFIIIFLPHKIYAETAFEFYMNDFYTKSNNASLILKEIETTLKEGSRKKVCTRQREAARLGLLANKSLIKAFELEGTKPPKEAIKANQRRWESLLNEC